MNKFCQKLGIFIIFTCLINQLARSQHFPSISVFNASVYQGSNQNWAIDQDIHNNLVVANSDGLLSFNGSQWSIYPSPNGTIIRSVKASGNMVYTGSFGDFGYWEILDNGRLEYQSIVSLLSIKLLEDEQFWKIVEFEGQIYFQSYRRIYVYNPKAKSLYEVTPKNGVSQLFNLGDQLIYHSLNDQLYTLDKGESIPFYQDDVLCNSTIVNMFYADIGLLAITSENGIFKYAKDQFVSWDIKANQSDTFQDIFSAIKLKNGDIALGTISKGLLVLDREGKLQYHFKQSNGLSNNTVLSMFEDHFDNLWLGLDNGINSIAIHSSVQQYSDKNGILGTVYASCLMQDSTLYVGTNQGLFYKSLIGNADFKLVKQTSGQVWSLYLFEGQLFCGHNKGTMRVEKGESKLISSVPGTWDIQEIPDQKDYLLQGNYSGFHLLKRNDNQVWSYDKPVGGFYSSGQQYLFWDNFIFINHPYKGLYKAKLSVQNAEFEELFLLRESNSSDHICFAHNASNLYYSNNRSMYVYQVETKDFIKDELLTKQLHDKGIIPITMRTDSYGRIWVFALERIFFLKNGPEKELVEVPISTGSLNIFMRGYENVNALSPSKALIGVTDGYLVIDLGGINDNVKGFEAQISSAQLETAMDTVIRLNLHEKGVFDYKSNDIYFSFGTPYLSKFQRAYYQYSLEREGQGEWSDWSLQPFVRYTNLEDGDYQFRLRSKMGNQLSQNISSYQFKIKKPWYLSIPALGIFTILVILLAYLINSFYRKYYSVQQEKAMEKAKTEMENIKLKNEQNLMALKNDQLLSEMDSKNNELAAITMNLVKKNEFLIELRESLAQSKADPDKIVKSINKEVENEETWEFFKNTFDHVDKGFFKKIKELHPDLTPNDLKLCAYLRLNLNSKDIAPLLNISIRSLETKRYRLRRKLDLDHDANLTDYIMGL